MTSAPDLYSLPGDSQLGIEEFPVNKIARHHAWNMSVDICKFQLFCFRFSSHLIKKRPFCYMAFHKCFVSSIVEMIGSIREIIPIQIGLSLSDEIREDVFAFLLLASASCFFFWFSFLVFRRRRPALVRKKATASGTGINEIHNLQEHDASFIRIIASLIILKLMLQTCEGGKLLETVESW